ncbi:MAG: DNA polymerase III subunit gamma/tau [bacterium]
MENFIVSARKYRPQTFDTVVGQKSITNTLKNAIRNNQVAQAFLFCGPRGVGKTTCARILAKTINCEYLTPNIEACDQCSSCVSFNENASFNIYELDGASNNSVDDIRTLVDQVRIPPQMGKYKVYIIDEVHMLSASAFNAFLKTLEEPPAYAKFILATTEKHKILPTILSRCQIFDFKRITVDDIASRLDFVASQEGITTEENAVHIIAQKADGAMRDALSIFDQLVSFTGNTLSYETVLENLNVLDYEYFFRITEFILNGDISGTLLTINEILDKGFDGQHFLIGFGEHLRNLLVCKDAVTAKLLETAPSIRNRYLEQCDQCTPGFLLQVLEINNRCDLNYKISNNKRLHLELALLQMCALGSQKSEIRNQKTEIGNQKSEIRSPKSEITSHSSLVISHSSPPPAGQKKMTGTVRMKDLSEDVAGTVSIRPGQKKDAEIRDPLAIDPSLAEVATLFSQELLNLRWDDYAEMLKPDYPHLFSMLKKHRPVLMEEFRIDFTIDNKLLEEGLNEKKGELLSYLRKELNNYKITLQTRISESDKNSKPYTDKEKFEKMAEKNPALRKLREELDLEIEF